MGRAIALTFADEGCSVVVADIREAEAKETVQDVAKKGRAAVFFRCDVSNINEVQRMVAGAIARFGKVDILVNCAGVGARPTAIGDITEQEWDRVLNINLKGTFFCCQAIVPHMKENRRGKIINISSLAAISPGSASVHYAASKAGVSTLTTGLALEMAPFNVCVNAILPGMIRTDMTADFAPAGVKDIDALTVRLAEGIPMKRMGVPQDIAGAALFLASELSSYVTGDGIIVGGGMPWSSVG